MDFINVGVRVIAAGQVNAAQHLPAHGIDRKLVIHAANCYGPERLFGQLQDEAVLSAPRLAADRRFVLGFRIVT